MPTQRCARVDARVFLRFRDCHTDSRERAATSVGQALAQRQQRLRWGLLLLGATGGIMKTNRSVIAFVAFTLPASASFSTVGIRCNERFETARCHIHFGRPLGRPKSNRNYAIS